MKTLLTFLLLATTGLLHAADPALHTYKGEVAGVMCSACSNHVQTALKTLPGVKDVTVLPAKNGGLPVLTVTSTSAALTKEAAIKALGDKANQYVIQSLQLQK
jgi:copper chaperone CopZ